MKRFDYDGPAVLDFFDLVRPEVELFVEGALDIERGVQSGDGAFEESFLFSRDSVLFTVDDNVLNFRTLLRVSEHILASL